MWEGGGYSLAELKRVGRYGVFHGDRRWDRAVALAFIIFVPLHHFNHLFFFIPISRLDHQLMSKEKEGVVFEQSREHFMAAL